MIAGLTFLLATIVVWVAVIAVSFLKGKKRLGTVLVIVTAVPVLAVAASLVDELWLSDTLDPDHDKAVELGATLLVMAWLAFGGLTGLIALVAAARPAKPGSWWAIRHDVPDRVEPREPERIADGASS